MQQRGIHRRRGSLRLGHAIHWWAESLESRLLRLSEVLVGFTDDCRAGVNRRGGLSGKTS